MWRLKINDIRRVCNHINGSIFGDECVIWQGYITNRNKPSKGPNINFYFQGNKVALHRLLFSNYIRPLVAGEYLKYTCENKGKCCNINHLECFAYARSNTRAKPKTEPKPIEESEDESDSGLILDF